LGSEMFVKDIKLPKGVKVLSDNDAMVACVRTMQ
jgi:hypothetical protein